ncbi:SufD family Fe-S cluster assembly protein [Sulfurovum sp.]|uniref:SufD family Fe-S cluster assembly protein n=1 Tax=Sulfurovum sp. TaxID=1969726 RepID=UPI002868315B|nr:SufD family Fe-S cluster assembly protein [Sulfurovum sp.]
MNLSTLKNQNLQEVNNLLDIEDRDILVERFVSLGLPNKKSEEYRYFDVEKLLEKEYKTLTYIPKTLRVSEKIEIVDGVVVAGPQGMRIYNEPCGQIDMEHFDPLYYLGHLLSPRAIKIELDGDIEVEIEHKFTQSDTLINYRIVLYNQANRHATVYENFVEEDIENTLVLYGYDMHIAQDSSLRVVKMQRMQNSGYSMVSSHRVNVAKNAHALFKSFDLGGDNALQLLKVELDERAHIDAGHLLYLNSSAKRGTVSQIVHRGEHSTSKQEAKNILDGDSRGIFDALIRVEPTGKFTKAEQNSKAILLHEKAYMASKPQLEIYIDELEASHGATTGQLDGKQLFYLQSRGISYTEARKILVIAFANTLIETVKDTRHQERIKAAFEDVFYATSKKG